ncbi:MAG TPA: hypothetical protein VFE33_13070 [Thermoanaerobaculia bacterium]|nr:hypothetical protein [Thermoanaerobaculia bacterium]
MKTFRSFRRGALRLALCGAALSLLAAAPVRAQEVTLPLSRYEELRTRANPEATPLPLPPAPFALEVADLTITASPAAARVVERLTLTLYAPGWQTVPLGPQESSGSFVAARLGDLEGRVVVGKDGSSLVVRGSGRHQVELESVLPVSRDETATRPTWKIALRPPAAAVVRGHLAAPKEIEEVAVEGEGLARRLPEGGWEVVGAPGAALDLTLRGRPILPERATLPLRFEATAATETVLSRTKLTVHGWIEARIAQGRLEQLVVPLPEGLAPVAVTGPLAGWNVLSGKLVITPLAPAETSLAVELDLTGPPRDRFASPTLVPEGSASTRLYARAALAGDGLLDLEPGAARIADEAEVARLPASFKSAQGRLLAIPDPARPPRWAASWAEKTEVLAAQIDRLRVDVLVGESGRASYELWAEVRNRGAQQLTFTLPAGFELAAGARNGLEIATGVAGTPGTLAVPLTAGEGAQVVHLKGLVPLALPNGGGDLAVPLPGLSAPAARVEMRLLLPGGRAYTLADETRAGAVAAPPSATAPNVPNASATGATLNNLSQQVLAAGRPSGAAGAPPLPTPFGFAEVQAVWSALSAAPAPLVLHVKSAKEKDSWF